MKKILLLILASCFTARAADFVHPLKFDGSDEQKQATIEYIKERVQQDYCEAINVCDESVLKMIEQENLSAFKRLTSATNSKILERTINDYCSLGFCDYDTIELMYSENLKASKKELSW